MSSTRLPALLASVTPLGFFGRQKEHDAVAALFDAAATGERQAVFVSGEPGVGKTSLAAEVARTLSARGAHVLYGRCDEEQYLAYQPFVEALDRYVQDCDSQRLRTFGDAHGGAIVRIVPKLL